MTSSQRTQTAHGHGEEAWGLFQVSDGASGEDAANRRHQQNTCILKTEIQRCLRNRNLNTIISVCYKFQRLHKDQVFNNMD